MEIFKDVKNYEGYYKVSNLGSVKSLERTFVRSNGRILTIKEGILNPRLNSRGYPTVGLYKDDKRKMRTIHQLVAESFLNHIPCGYKLVINHIDFNKNNNKLENLEITTQRDNANLKHIKSSSRFTGVYWNKQAKKWKSQIWINGKQKYLGYFICELEASKAYEKTLSDI